MYSKYDYPKHYYYFYLFLYFFFFLIFNFYLCDLDLSVDTDKNKHNNIQRDTTSKQLNMRCPFLTHHELHQVIKCKISTSVTLIFDLTVMKFAYSCSAALGLYAYPAWCPNDCCLKVIGNFKALKTDIYIHTHTERQGKNNMPPIIDLGG